MGETISVVIPCYRSENTIAAVVEELESCLHEIEHEIILVCDCSPDNVWEVIKSLHQKYDRVQGILFSKNYGQHAATMAGYRQAKGDIIVTMDDDGQSDPSAIPHMIDKIHEGYDVVYARYPSTEKGLFRKFGSWLNRVMSEYLAGKPKNVQGNSYFAMLKFVKDEIVRYTGPFPYLGGLVFRSTSLIGEIEVNHRQRKHGKSSYTLKKLLLLWINGFTAFSILPLRLSSLFGFFFSTVGFILGLVFIVRKLINPSIVLGYSSIMVTLFFIGGVLLIAVGIIGEYVGRIYINLNHSPQYVIKDNLD